MERAKDVSFVWMRIKKIQNFLSADQTTIPGVNQVFPVLEWNLIFVLLSKILDRLKRLFVVQMYKFLESLFIERCGTYTFNSFSLALWRSRNEGDLFKFGSSKIDANKSCHQLLKIVLRYRGHLHEESVGRIFRYSMEWKTYDRHSVKKCTKYPFDSSAHLKTVHRLWFPTSDRLDTWLILSGTIRSKQYH